MMIKTIKGEVLVAIQKRKYMMELKWQLNIHQKEAQGSGSGLSLTISSVSHFLNSTKWSIVSPFGILILVQKVILQTLFIPLTNNNGVNG